MRKKRLSLFCLLMLWSFPVQANDAYLLKFYNDDKTAFEAAPGIASDVRVDVQGTIAKVEITQYFYNPSAQFQEAVYSYPLPDGAAVDRLTMMIGNERVIGFVHEKQKAKEIYEQAKEDGKGTALLEQDARNLFKTSVANIPPETVVAINFSYQTDVALQNRIFELALPLAVTPRYDRLSNDDVMRVAHNQEWAKAVLEKVYLSDFKGGKNPVDLGITLDAGFDIQPVQSPSHAITQKQSGERFLIFPKIGVTPSDRDFIIRWQPKNERSLISALHSQKVGDSYYSHLLLLPPNDFDTRAAKPAKHVTFVLDISGSMGGLSLRQAKSALVKAVNSLGRQDSFNIITFESETEILYNSPVEASESAKRDAIAKINALQEKGGTEMLPAVKAALSQPVLEGKLRQVVFMTDAAIGYEDEVRDMVRNHLGETRFFVVGIGLAPNRSMVDQVARAGRGTAIYISDMNELDEKVTTLFEKMSAPVLTDLKLDGLPMRAEVIPAKIPDILAGDPVKLVIRSKAPIKSLRLHGKKGGENWRLPFKPSKADHKSAELNKVFARAEMDDLLFKSSYRVPSEIEREVTRIALRHQLVSQYTSLVAVSETVLRREGEPLTSVRYDPSLPHSWTEHHMKGADAAERYADFLERKAKLNAENEAASEYDLPSTATGYQLSLLFGLSLLLAGAAFVRRVRYAA